jgi:hypothetical protein
LPVGEAGKKRRRRHHREGDRLRSVTAPGYEQPRRGSKNHFLLASSSSRQAREQGIFRGRLLKHVKSQQLGARAMNGAAREKLYEYVESCRNDHFNLLDKEYDVRALICLVNAQLAVLKAIEWQIGGVHEQTRETIEFQMEVRKTMLGINFFGVVWSVVLFSMIFYLIKKGY